MSAAVERVVRDRLGVDPSTLGTGAIERAVQARMIARAITEPSLYAARLMTEAAERDALAAALSVSETWFFRGGRVLFDRLAGFVLTRTGRAAVGARVLSVPCSTGEEPYSLAIALQEQLGSPDGYTIDAVDVSEPNLARATAARYPSSSFREPGPDVRPPYFRKVGDQWELLPHIRTAVRPLAANLADPLFLAAERPYDLILCRNVFIYFTPEAKQRAVANLDRLLALDGRLCLTPAEADRLPPGRFSPDGPPEFGIYRRAGSLSSVHAVLPADPHPTGPEPPPSRVPAPPPTAPVAGTLAAARALADAGRLADARAACEKLIRSAPGDADAFALLGVVCLASGNTDGAYDAFGKALYLVPDHPEAATHMITLCERRGQPARAAALRKRLAKLPPGDGP